MASAADLQEQPAPQGLIQDVSSQEPPPVQGMDYVSGLASSVGQGASASWLDEALAAPMAGVAQVAGAAPEGESVSETYQKMKESLRGRQQRFTKSEPAAAAGAQLLGGMAPMAKVLQGGGLAKTAAVGAGYGAAEYAGGLDDWSDASVVNAAVQTGLSAALPAGMQKTGAGIKKWLGTRKTAEVDSVINRLVEDTGLTPQELRTRAKDYGPEASISDVAGAPGVHYAQGVAGVGDAKTMRIIEQNQEKIYAAKDRIRDTMTDVSGKKDGQYFESFDELAASRKANAERNYGEALDKGSVVPTDRMLKIIEQNPTVKDSWARVQDVYERRGLTLPKLFDFDDAGKAVWTGERFPNMRAMQELKWEMDKTLKSLKGSVDAAGKKEYQRTLEDYKEFMGDVNKQNPDFAKANAQYAGDSAMMDAQEMGMKHGLGGDTVEAQLKHIEGLNTSEKDAYLQGVMANSYGKMGTSPGEVMGNINRIASENSNRVLSKLVGKDKSKKLMGRIRKEKRYREVDSKVRQNSQTAQRQQAADVMSKKLKTIPTSELLNPVGQNIARQMVDKVKLFSPKMSMGQVNEVADILTKPGGTEKALLRLEMSGMSRREAQGLFSAVMASGATAAPGSLMGTD